MKYICHRDSQSNAWRHEARKVTCLASTFYFITSNLFFHAYSIELRTKYPPLPRKYKFKCEVGHAASGKLLVSGMAALRNPFNPHLFSSREGYIWRLATLQQNLPTLAWDFYSISFSSSLSSFFLNSTKAIQGKVPQPPKSSPRGNHYYQFLKGHSREAFTNKHTYKHIHKLWNTNNGTPYTLLCPRLLFLVDLGDLLTLERAEQFHCVLLAAWSPITRSLRAGTGRLTPALGLQFLF